jgi:hypothetical protein
MSARSRRAFVAVVTASAASLVSATAAANPPAPSTVPDPLKLTTLKTGETPYRIRRHDGGCYVYGEAGPVGKTDCQKEMDKAGEEIEREPDSGQCIIIEPWSGEPKEITCPAILVPPGWVPKVKPASLAVKADPPAPVAMEPAKAKTGCSGGCEVSSHESSNVVPMLGAAAAVVIATRRRRRR